MKTSRRAFLARLMTEAWALARQGAQKFGGNAQLYFAIALRLVWQDSRPRTVWHRGLGNQFVLPGIKKRLAPRTSKVKESIVDIDKKTLRAIKKECREMAREMTREHYKLYDDIWWDRIRIDSALYDHGKETIREINQRMPNLLTHDPTISPLDIVSERYGFESTSALVEFLLAYTPRGPVEERFFEQFLAERLGAYETPATQTEADEVPF